MTPSRRAGGPGGSGARRDGYDRSLGVRLRYTLPIALLLALLLIAEWLGLS